MEDTQLKELKSNKKQWLLLIDSTLEKCIVVDYY